MGKAARNKKNRAEKPMKKRTPNTARTRWEEQPPGTFMDDFENATEVHQKDLFFVYSTHSDGASYWVDLADYGRVEQTPENARLLLSLLGHELTQKWSHRTSGGPMVRMDNYLALRVAEGSLSHEYAPALVLMTLGSRFMVNACRSIHLQTGEPITRFLLEQVEHQIGSLLTLLAEPFGAQLDVEKIIDIASLKCFTSLVENEVWQGREPAPKQAA